MNTHDVSTSPDYAQLLTQQKQAFRDAEIRKGQRPQGRKSQAQLRTEFLFQRLLRSTSTNRTFEIRATFIPPAYKPCVVPQEALKKIMIDELLLETQHRGRYAMLRCVTPPNRLHDIMVVVEDEQKDALLLQLCNQEPESDRAAEDFIGENVVVIVKEPYFKQMATGGYGLRVDHLSDIVFLAEDDKLVPACWMPRIVEQETSAGVWKTHGNDCFKSKKYFKAIEQ
jgi:hypothetical protein